MDTAATSTASAPNMGRATGATKVPHEILVMIFDLAIAAVDEEEAASDKPRDALTQGDARIATAGILCRVCRAWNGPATQRLYRDWAYHGEIHSVRSIWRFVVTILTNAKLAALVRTVELRNWDWGDSLDWSEHGSTRGQDMEHMAKQHCTDKEKVLIMEAWKQIGPIPQAWSEAFSRLGPQSAGVPWSACMALALAYMLNLSTLQAAVCRDPSWALTRVFTMAATGKVMSHGYPVFPNLADLKLHGEWVDFNRAGGLSGYVNLRTWANPVFSLPSLEHLSLFDLSLRGSFAACMELARSSSIKHLTIQNSEVEAVCLRDTAENFWALVAIPRALDSLTMYLCNPFLDRNPAFIRSLKDEESHVSDELIDRIMSQHAETLRHLDVQDVDIYGRLVNRWLDPDAQHPFVAAMASRLPLLGSLKHLAYDIGYLLDSEARMFVVNAPPPGLETLALTLSDWGMSTFRMGQWIVSDLGPLYLLRCGQLRGMESLQFVSVWKLYDNDMMGLYWWSNGHQRALPSL